MNSDRQSSPEERSSSDERHRQQEIYKGDSSGVQTSGIKGTAFQRFGTQGWETKGSETKESETDEIQELGSPNVKTQGSHKLETSRFVSKALTTPAATDLLRMPNCNRDARPVIGFRSSVGESGSDLGGSRADPSEARTRVEGERIVIGAGTNLRATEKTLSEAGAKISGTGTNVREAGSIEGAGAHVKGGESNYSEGVVHGICTRSNASEAVPEINGNRSVSGTIKGVKSDVGGVKLNIVEAKSYLLGIESDVKDARTNTDEGKSDMVEAKTSVTDAVKATREDRIAVRSMAGITSDKSEVRSAERTSAKIRLDGRGCETDTGVSRSNAGGAKSLIGTRADVERSSCYMGDDRSVERTTARIRHDGRDCEAGTGGSRSNPGGVRSVASVDIERSSAYMSEVRTAGRAAVGIRHNGGASSAELAGPKSNPGGAKSAVVARPIISGPRASVVGARSTMSVAMGGDRAGMGGTRSTSDRISTLLKEANDISEYLNKPYVFSRYEPGADDAGTRGANGGDEGGPGVRVHDTKRHLFSIWSIPTLRQRLVSLRKLVYSEDSKNPANNLDQLFGINDDWKEIGGQSKAVSQTSQDHNSQSDLSTRASVNYQLQIQQENTNQQGQIQWSISAKDVQTFVQDITTDVVQQQQQQQQQQHRQMQQSSIGRPQQHIQLQRLRQEHQIDEQLLRPQHFIAESDKGSDSISTVDSINGRANTNISNSSYATSDGTISDGSNLESTAGVKQAIVDNLKDVPDEALKGKDLKNRTSRMHDEIVQGQVDPAVTSHDDVMLLHSTPEGLEDSTVVRRRCASVTEKPCTVTKAGDTGQRKKIILSQSDSYITNTRCADHTNSSVMKLKSKEQFNARSNDNDQTSIIEPVVLRSPRNVPTVTLVSRASLGSKSSNDDPLPQNKDALHTLQSVVACSLPQNEDTEGSRDVKGLCRDVTDTREGQQCDVMHRICQELTSSTILRLACSSSKFDLLDRILGLCESICLASQQLTSLRGALTEDEENASRCLKSSQLSAQMMIALELLTASTTSIISTLNLFSTGPDVANLDILTEFKRIVREIARQMLTFWQALESGVARLIDSSGTVLRESMVELAVACGRVSIEMGIPVQMFNTTPERRSVTLESINHRSQQSDDILNIQPSAEIRRGFLQGTDMTVDKTLHTVIEAVEVHQQLVRDVSERCPDEHVLSYMQDRNEILVQVFHVMAACRNYLICLQRIHVEMHSVLVSSDVALITSEFCKSHYLRNSDITVEANKLSNCIELMTNTAQSLFNDWDTGLFRTIIRCFEMTEKSSGDLHNVSTGTPGREKPILNSFDSSQTPSSTKGASILRQNIGKGTNNSDKAIELAAQQLNSLEESFVEVTVTLSAAVDKLKWMIEQSSMQSAVSEVALSSCEASSGTTGATAGCTVVRTKRLLPVVPSVNIRVGQPARCQSAIASLNVQRPPYKPRQSLRNIPETFPSNVKGSANL